MQIEISEIEDVNTIKQGLLQLHKSKKTKVHTCLLSLCNYKTYQQFVTSNQFSEIERLVQESKLKADLDDPQTKGLLLALYHNAFPSRPIPELKGNEWTDLGFQSENPLSDLRSSGKLSLENIYYFSDHHQSLFAQMIQNSTEYPFIASAINITALLLIHLNIVQDFTFCPCCGTSFKRIRKAPIKEMATFANLLEDCSWETVFNELFSLSVILMDTNYWKKVKRDPSFTILDFRGVFVDTKNQLLSALRKQPRSIDDLYESAQL